MPPEEINEKMSRLGFRKSQTKTGTPVWVNPTSGAVAAIDVSQKSIGTETLHRFLETLQISWKEFDAA